MELYLYQSEDGIWRQRCKAHISTQPGQRPRNPAFGHMRFPSTQKRTCIACYYQQKENALESHQAARAPEHSERITYAQPHSTTSRNDDQALLA